MIDITWQWIANQIFAFIGLIFVVLIPSLAILSYDIMKILKKIGQSLLDATENKSSR